MKEGPDIARLGALIGDPARANILTALMSGKALSASELALEAGVTAQTVSAHLAKLEAGGLIAGRRQGRHRYFALAGPEAAALLESVMGFAQHRGHLRSRIGPRDPALRAARICYDHLAGAAGVRMFEAMLAGGALRAGADGLELTPRGGDLCRGLGIEPDALAGGRAPLCRECLDWSERRSHLAGRLGRALLAAMRGNGWLEREEGSRVVRFTRTGRARFEAAFPLPDLAAGPVQVPQKVRATRS